ncbi:MAG: glycerol dehydrogenase [Maritimibacter sp.]|nr:glycerol dehydrogenase [Maritimibacter sp.]MCB1356449.1 glycerol dehydrogenase [Maritimibacter sp.]
MSAGELKGVRFPGRYIQGPGALARLGPEVAAYGPRALVLLDAGVFALFEAQVRAAVEGHGQADIARFGGECTLGAIEAAAAAARETGAAVIVGMGGGKALDAAKAAGVDAGLPVIVVPTIAASDAPCSALSVIYNDDGSVSHDRFLPRNPDLVLVDTAIIAAAPPRFLAAGIGDALATWYEAASCEKSGGLNCLSLPGLPLAFTIAAACRDVIFEHGAAAMAECARGEAGPALERIVEANILMSGLGFESGGVATAHAVHHGLTMLDETHHALHGEKVAIGILTGLAMQRQEAEFARVAGFFEAVGLPTRLADIGLAEASAEKLRVVAERACRPGEIIHNEPYLVEPDMVVAALGRLA